MKRPFITLTLTLVILRISLGQDLKKDIEDGLYLWSSGFVMQKSEDTLRISQLRMSKVHTYRIADLLLDSASKANMLSESDPIWDNIKPAQVYWLMKPSKIVDLVEISRSSFSIIFHAADTGFVSANFIKRDVGYEVYFLSHNSKGRKAIKSIKNDTTAHFMSYAFTLNDLRTLNQRKNPIELDDPRWEALWDSLHHSIALHKDVMKLDMPVYYGLNVGGLKSLGESGRRDALHGLAILKIREIILKGLLERGYNPLEDPDSLLIKRDKRKR